MEQTWRNTGLEIPVSCSDQCRSALVVFSERMGRIFVLTPGTRMCAEISVHVGDEGMGRSRREGQPVLSHCLLLPTKLKSKISVPAQWTR